MSNTQSYIGSKIVRAEPMNKCEFNINIKGVDCKEENEEGYLVIYPDNYQSWSPKKTFEEAYRLISDGEEKLIN